MTNKPKETKDNVWHFTEILGKTITEIEVNTGDGLHYVRFFFGADKSTFLSLSAQDPCGCDMSAELEDICGDLNDLKGKPLIVAKRVSGETVVDDYRYRQLYTFYEFATIKGSVTLRFNCQDNSYYSVDVEEEFSDSFTFLQSKIESLSIENQQLKEELKNTIKHKNGEINFHKMECEQLKETFKRINNELAQKLKNMNMGAREVLDLVEGLQGKNNSDDFIRSALIALINEDKYGLFSGGIDVMGRQQELLLKKVRF